MITVLILGLLAIAGAQQPPNIGDLPGAQDTEMQGRFPWLAPEFDLAHVGGVGRLHRNGRWWIRRDPNGPLSPGEAPSPVMPPDENAVTVTQTMTKIRPQGNADGPETSTVTRTENQISVQTTTSTVEETTLVYTTISVPRLLMETVTVAGDPVTSLVEGPPRTSSVTSVLVQTDMSKLNAELAQLAHSVEARKCPVPRTVTQVIRSFCPVSRITSTLTTVSTHYLTINTSTEVGPVTVTAYAAASRDQGPPQSEHSTSRASGGGARDWDSRDYTRGRDSKKYYRQNDPSGRPSEDEGDRLKTGDDGSRRSGREVGRDGNGEDRHGKISSSHCKGGYEFVGGKCVSREASADRSGDGPKSKGTDNRRRSYVCRRGSRCLKNNTRRSDTDDEDNSHQSREDASNSNPLSSNGSQTDTPRDLGSDRDNRRDTREATHTRGQKKKVHERDGSGGRINRNRSEHRRVNGENASSMAAKAHQVESKSKDSGSSVASPIRRKVSWGEIPYLPFNYNISPVVETI